MSSAIYKILIIEDTPERQEILRRLYKDHAWILVHTAARAKVLLNAYDFDLISLDYNLAGPEDGDAVASSIARSRNAGSKVIIHSMNPQGAQRMMQMLPHAEFVPISKMVRNNQTFKRLRQELLKGLDINWAFVFSGEKTYI